MFLHVSLYSFILPGSHNKNNEHSFKFSLIKNLFLHRYLEYHTDCCVIDSFNNIYSVLDRLEIQENSTSLGGSQNWRPLYNQGPHFLKVLCLDGFLVMVLLYQVFFFLSIQPWYSFEGMINWDLSVPSIVKPQVACGVLTRWYWLYLVSFWIYVLLIKISNSLYHLYEEEEEEVTVYLG